MIVKELKRELAKMNDDVEVQVAVRVFTRAYAVAYLSIMQADRSGSGATLWVTFPEGTVVSQRKR